MLSPELEILETTLRDGNYLVNFQFTTEDTAWLCARFEECGLNKIEIGHGLGMGASRVYKPAAVSDAEYIKAARRSLKNAEFGMFAIPGVATLDDLSMAADLGMNFVRIGANVDRVDTMEEYIAKARSLGLFVYTNFMKSYCLPPEEFSKIGAIAEGFGSQMNYIVDSAGGMLPDDIRVYFSALKDATGIPTGFHGHDNIRLAIANSLVAAESGAVLIDTTLFGIGRGSGNAATELLAALLKQRFGLLQGIDERRLLHIAEREAAPMLRHRHSDSISMSLGLAQVHSMHLEDIVECAVNEGINYHDLIAQVGRVDRLKVDDEVLAKAVVQAKETGEMRPIPDDGVLSLRVMPSVNGVVSHGENLAEKFGLPCWLRVTELDGETNAEVLIKPNSIEIHVTGDPKPAIKAAKRKITSIVVAPSLSGSLESFKALTDLPVAVA